MSFERLKSIMSGAVNVAINKAENKVRPDLQGVIAMGGAFALLVYADGVIEDQEKDDVGDALIGLPIIIEKGLTRDVAEAFLSKLADLEAAFSKSRMDGQIIIGDTLTEISQIKEDTVWAKEVADTVTLITASGAEACEVLMRERVVAALGRTPK